MALKQPKTLSSGVTAEYYKITRVSLDRFTKKVSYELSLYLNKDKSIDKSPPVIPAVKTYSFILTKEQAESNLISLGYDLIKLKASTMVTVDLSGRACSPRPFDADLSEAEDI